MVLIDSFILLYPLKSSLFSYVFPQSFLYSSSFNRQIYSFCSAFTSFKLDICSSACLRFFVVTLQVISSPNLTASIFYSFSYLQEFFSSWGIEILCCFNKDYSCSILLAFFQSCSQVYLVMRSQAHNSSFKCILTSSRSFNFAAKLIRIKFCFQKSYELYASSGIFFSDSRFLIFFQYYSITFFC